MPSQGLLKALMCLMSVLLIGPAPFVEGLGRDGLWKSKAAACPTTIFNFGDSLSDTGNVILAFPFFSEADYPPNGMTFFGKQTGRFSNGRLVIDFIALAFGHPLIDPYLQTVAHDFVHGVNFAYAGATASEDDYFLPFFLGFQVSQFVRFKHLTQTAQQNEAAFADFNRYLPAQGSFSSALYTIAIGGNDILVSFLRNETPQLIIAQKVPLAVQGVVQAIETLYKQEAKNFLIFNVPPEGCATTFLTLLEVAGLPRDDVGCLAAVNVINEALNAALLESIQKLRSSLPDVTISYFDYYSANFEILRNPSLYGFNPDLKFTACCGAPGQGSLNYNFNVTCGRPGTSACSNPDDHIIWDGVHFTEAFYRVIAKFVLNGQYVDPPLNLTSACGLSFENFGQTTYSEVFPSRPLLI